jgi:TonB family protein
MLEQLEQQEAEAQQIESRVLLAPVYPAENDQRQRRRMVVALILLLVALGLVLVKDRDFWFPATNSAETEPMEDAAPVATAEPISGIPATVSAKPSIPAGKRKNHSITPAKSQAAAPAAAPVVTATRAVLPPLRVEVVAGDRRQMVRPGSPSVRVDLQPGMAVQPAPEEGRTPSEAGRSSAALTNAGERVQMSSDTRQALSRPVRPEYPLLARQMKVQGAVVLETLIGKDGGIQNIRVLGGPSILADAAREAVKQWRFKPYFQDGQPVETQARVTVNFTISTN